MKKNFIIFVLFAASGLLLQAQQIITIGAGTSFQSAPLCGTNGYERTVTIYKPSDGLVAGTVLTLAWNRPSATHNIPVTIYLKEIPDATLPDTASLIWNTLISNAAMVYEDTLKLTSGTSWTTTRLQTPFSYSGTGNLMVMVATNVGGNGGRTVNMAYTGGAANANMNAYAKQNGSINDSGPFSMATSKGRNANRPNIQIGIDPSSSCPMPLPWSLTVSNITPTNAEISWSPRGSETQWIVSYKASTEDTWTDIVTDSWFYSFANTLDPMTSYSVKVRAYCAPGDTSYPTNTVSFFTPCFPAVLPILEGFETTSTSNPSAPDCWSYIKTSSGAYTNGYTTSPHSGSKCYFMSHPSTSANTNQTMLISPYILEDITIVRARFWAKYASGSSANQLRVGFMRNPTDTSSFRVVSTISLSSTWTEYTVYFNTAEENCHYVAFSAKASTSNSVFLDDIIIEPVSNCPDITGIKVSDITSVHASITCDEIEEAISYDVRYRKKGSANWTERGNVSVPYLISGLDHSKKYEACIRSRCNEGLGSWSNPVEFWTAFDLPIFQALDSTTVDGWDFFSLGREVMGSVSNISGAYYSSPKGVALTIGIIYSPTIDKLYWRSPKINPDISMSTVQVSFKARANVQNLNLQLGVMNADSINSFELVETVLLSPEWRTYIVSFSGYIGENHHIAFGHNGNPINTNIYIDNVDITLIPDCQRVSNFFVSDLHENGFDLHWRDAQAGGYTIEYTSEAGTFTQTASTHMYSFAGLAPETEYSIRVKSNCTPEIWSEPFKVKTTQTPVSIPFSENFEGTPDWRFINGSQTNQWHIGTATNNTAGGSHAVYISDDNGNSNHYVGVSSIQHIYAIKAVKLNPNTDYQIDYDWKCVGETTSTDNLRVWLAPATSTLYAGYAPASVTNTADWINLYGTTTLSGHNTWQNKSMVFRVPVQGVYNLTFYWLNDAFVDNQPPAAVDNISITPLPCIVPSQISVRNVATTSADIHFSVSQYARFIHFFYKPAFATEWDSVRVTISNSLSDTLYTLNGLLPGTAYQIYSKSECAGGLSANTATYSFQTICAPVSIPFLETFDGSGTTFPPTCWEHKSLLYDPARIMNTSDMAAGANGWAQATVNGNKTADINITGNTKKNWLISPVINLGTNANLSLEFDVKLSGSSNGAYAPVRGADDKFIVLISTDSGQTWNPANATEWSGSASANYPYSDLNNNFRTIHIPLTGITGNIRAAFYAESTIADASDYLFIDNVAIANCAKPENIVISNITPTSANITWTHPSATNFLIEYKTENASSWIPQSASGNSYSISALTPDVKYMFRMRTNCGGDYSFYSPAALFSTPCATLGLPIFESFDSTENGSISSPNAPECWSYIKDFQNANANVNSNTPFSSPKCYYMNNSTSSTTQKTALVSPYFSEPINSVRARFMAKGGITGNILIIGYMTNPNDMSTFVTQDSIPLVSSWAEYRVSFNTATSNGNYIAFLHGRTGNAQSIYLDDIFIELIPSCADVTEVNVTNIMSNSAIARWNPVAGAIGYEVQYRSQGYPYIWSNSMSVATDTCIISGLQPTTSYEVRVRSKCSATDTGIWAFTVSFATTCSPAGLTYVEDFSTFISTTSQPACWEIKTGLLNTDGTSTALINNSLSSFTWTGKLFANRLATSRAAKLNIQGSKTKEWLISRPIDLENTGNATLEFDLALVKAGDSTVHTGTCDDDKFIVLISSDGNWSINNVIATWDNMGSSRVFNSISSVANGDHISIPLTGFRGVVRVAFYGESTSSVSNGDNDLFVDNVTVSKPFVCEKVNNLRVSHIGTEANATWLPGNDDQSQWMICCNKVGGPESAPIPISGNPAYTFSNLERGSSYTISVWAVCSFGNSDTVTSSSFTISNCALVENIQISSCATFAVVSWLPGEGQNEWEWICTPQGGGLSMQNIVNQPTDTIKGLQPGTSYRFQIRSICNPEDTSEYTPAKMFQTILCQKVENITTPRNNTNDSAFVSWNYNPCHQSWEVRIVPENGDVNSVASTFVNTYQGIWFLLPDATRTCDVYVRANCGGATIGEWQMTKSYKTGVNVASLSAIKITLAPNPARNYAKLSIEGVNGEVEMTLATSEGKVLRREKINCQSTFTKDIILQDLAKGAYLIHLTHKNWVKVEKLIVQ